MNEKEERLSVMYIKLEFRLLFPEDTVLPKEKVSALRGGMGEMLLRQNCVSDRICEECVFEDACIVRKTMYTQMKRKPFFMQGDDSVGYLIECENYQTEISAGDEICFSLTLFGNNIVYFGQYLQAFYQLGVHGIGKHRSKFQIAGITTMYGEPLLENGNVQMKFFRPEYLSDYVERRKAELAKKGCRNKIVFQTPLSLKFKGEYLREFHEEAFFTAVFRRIMMLDYFSEIYLDMPEMESFPRIIRQEAREKSVQRYSSTQDSKVTLKGIRGYLHLENIQEEYLAYVLAGELLHIGKNSSFGFGKYRLE